MSLLPRLLGENRDPRHEILGQVAQHMVETALDSVTQS
jgi:hypothetical protein